MSQKIKNQIVIIFFAFITLACIYASFSAEPKAEITPAAAHEFSIEEKLEQKNKEIKIAWLESELVRQENVTLTSLKREEEIKKMAELLKSGECTDLEQPENCLKVETVKQEESPKAPAVK